ncbi:amino acid adenylation domain-containing protein [Pseudomonas putida]|uniref:amino acid adenylation domain-containing protein n=1 Tax=Pseudomonas putida TaxID=303 RepID=UPI00236539BD|nr:amino acid adenylation domain-containing protein [Pseudomonas putida]MDD2050654.1 amino acid adenylation domain-containing protein [Pseudomonas putida]
MQELIDSIGVLSAQERKALAILLKKEGVNLFDVAPVFKRDPAEPLKLSYAQERQWFLWQLEPHSAAYHIPAALRLRGALDLSALQRSFAVLVARHESLRTHFTQVEGQTRQLIAADLAIDLKVQLIGACSEAQVRALVEAQVQQSFDLQTGPLLRVSLMQVSEQEHVLVLVQHHIISDGWSMQIMVQELVACYQAFAQGLTPQLPPLPIQYADYALWQRSWMEAGERARQLQYWTAQLGSEQPVLELPLDHSRPASQSYRGGRVDVPLGLALSKGLQDLAQQQGVTLFMLLLASFQVLLHRYSGQSDIRVGVPNANRNRPETQRLIGFFVNTQVLKADIHGRQSFAQLLQQVKQTALQAQAHQDLPFEQLVEALQPERSLSQSPLFQAMYNHQSAARGGLPTQQLDGLSIEEIVFESQAAQFDLSLDTFESDQGLVGAFTYMSELFEHATLERMGGHWSNLLQAIVAQPHAAVDELDLLDARQRHQLLQQWSGVQGYAQPGPHTVLDLIEAQVAKTPEAVALVHEDRHLTYRQMNAQANLLANRLLAVGVGAESRVGIAVERGLGMVIAVLAVLKCGGAYVPMDPQYPADRLQLMIEDAGLACLLSQSWLLDALAVAQDIAKICLDRVLDEHDGSEYPDPCRTVDPDNLAYVMFTSGSTGRPKGVAISQAALTAHVQMCIGFFGLVPSDRVLQFATFNFDGFIEQLFPALSCGAAVVLRGNEIWSSEMFHQALITQGISVADLTTAYWAMLAKDFAAQPRATYGALRQVHAGGEAMSPDALAAWHAAGLDGVRLLNTYGPTEATVTVSAHDCSTERSGSSGTANPPIGQVLPGRSLYVVDGSGALAPIGVIGELMIGGDLLARGYFSRPGLSAERFMPNPFEPGGGRLYRSGDLVRRLANGDLEYVGRSDHQIKLRGFRIELSEIEAKLLEHPQIREALVVPVEGPAGMQLVAYLVAPALALGEVDWRAPLKAWLKARLPDYMVPAHLLRLQAMPLSPNGKLDRRALPAPDPDALRSLHLAPASDLEKRVAAIWQDLLKVPAISMHDNFFELGGHSLLAIQVMARVQLELGANIALSLLFKDSTLQGFTQAITPLVSLDMHDTLDALHDFLTELEAN